MYFDDVFAHLARDFRVAPYYLQIGPQINLSHPCRPFEGRKQEETNESKANREEKEIIKNKREKKCVRRTLKHAITIGQTGITRL